MDAHGADGTDLLQMARPLMLRAAISTSSVPQRGRLLSSAMHISQMVGTKGRIKTMDADSAQFPQHRYGVSAVVADLKKNRRIQIDPFQITHLFHRQVAAVHCYFFNNRLQGRLVILETVAQCSAFDPDAAL